MKKITDSEKVRRKEIGLRLKKLRNVCNLSQTDIAFAIHSGDWDDKAKKSGKAFISRVESGTFVLSDEDAEKIAEAVNRSIDLNQENIRKRIEDAYNVHEQESSFLRKNGNIEQYTDYTSMHLDPDYLTGKSSYYNAESGVVQQQQLTTQFTSYLIPIINLLGYKLLDPVGNELNSSQNTSVNSANDSTQSTGVFTIKYIGDNYFPLYKVVDEPIMRSSLPNQYENEHNIVRAKTSCNLDNLSLRLKSPEGKIVIIYPADFRDMILNIYQDIDISLLRALQRGKPIDNTNNDH